MDEDIKAQRYDMLVHHLRQGKTLTLARLRQSSETHDIIEVVANDGWFDHWDEPKEV